MNFLYVLRLLGLLLGVLALSMGISLAVQVVGFAHANHAEKMAAYALTCGVALTAGVGLVTYMVGRRGATQTFNRRDAMLLVAVGWVVGAALAALPFYVWAQLGGTAGFAMETAHPFERFSACYFEAMSGLSTTGATVLSTAPHDIESLPRGLLLWRAMTHWLGGLGIVVLFVAVLPLVGVGGKKLFMAEAAGPSRGVRPRIKETARVLWIIYLSLTVAQILMLKVAGMPWFHSVCHTFSTLASGGLSSRNASIGAYYDNASIVWITTLFMILAGVNFALYAQVAKRNFRAVLTDPELRVYLLIIAVCATIVFTYLAGQRLTRTDGLEYTTGVGGAIRGSLFQVVSVMTGTGFATLDFNQWPLAAKVVLGALMLVGGCAGSTTGGLKVVRLMIVGRVILAEFERVFRPNVIKPIRVGGTVVDDGLARSAFIYILLVLALWFVGSFLIVVIEPTGSIGFVSAASASLATLMNVGPGFGAVGAVENYGFFSNSSLLLLSFFMALGRLEVFALLVLFLPRFWHET